MIKEVTGSIFDADVEALVNPVNCVGVMGAGLAKEFKERYPEYFEVYRGTCLKGELRLSGLLFYCVANKGINPRWILSFPTKYHWKDTSNLENIQRSLNTLKYSIRQSKISSIAIPALGCGLGGLDWKVVKPLIYAILGDLEDVEILLYPPQ